MTYRFAEFTLFLCDYHKTVDQSVSVVFANSTNLIITLICVKVYIFKRLLQLLGFLTEHVPESLLFCLKPSNEIRIQSYALKTPLAHIMHQQLLLPFVQGRLLLQKIMTNGFSELVKLFEWLIFLLVVLQCLDVVISCQLYLFSYRLLLGIQRRRNLFEQLLLTSDFDLFMKFPDLVKAVRQLVCQVLKLLLLFQDFS